ncbi:UNVERIFIED_CONTAM: hypothetical protein GTU68_029916 [Idotea baltica]|nr:hypothetical protein [Idotea baltica]
MLYAIFATDIVGTQEKRSTARSEHLKRLELLKQEGRLVLAGPHPLIESLDSNAQIMTGSLIVAEFRTLSEAEVWVQQDPYNLAGVYDAVQIKPFKQVFP